MGRDFAKTPRKKIASYWQSRFGKVVMLNNNSVHAPEGDVVSRGGRMTRFSFDKRDGELWVAISLQRFSHFLTKEQAIWLKEELEDFIKYGEETEVEEEEV